MHDWTLVQSCIFYAFSPLFRNRPSLLVLRPGGRVTTLDSWTFWATPNRPLLGMKKYAASGLRGLNRLFSIRTRHSLPDIHSRRLKERLPVRQR